MELASPSALARNGWTSRTLKVGDKVTVEGYAAKVAPDRGNARSVVTADGRSLFGGAADDKALPAAAPSNREGHVRKVLVFAGILAIVRCRSLARAQGAAQGGVEAAAEAAPLGPVNALGQEVRRPPAPTGPAPRLPDGTIDLATGSGTAAVRSTPSRRG